MPRSAGGWKPPAQQVQARAAGCMEPGRACICISRVLPVAGGRHSRCRQRSDLLARSAGGWKLPAQQVQARAAGCVEPGRACICISRVLPAGGWRQAQSLPSAARPFGQARRCKPAPRAAWSPVGLAFASAVCFQRTAGRGPADRPRIERHPRLCRYWLTSAVLLYTNFPVKRLESG